MYIRMNVDDFEEAYAILTTHGLTNTRGDGTLDTKSAKEATMVSPSGFRIALVKHIKIRASQGQNKSSFTEERTLKTEYIADNIQNLEEQKS